VNRGDRVILYSESLKSRDKFLAFSDRADSVARMIQSGFVSEEDRKALTALARDGSSPCRIADDLVRHSARPKASIAFNSSFVNLKTAGLYSMRTCSTILESSIEKHPPAAAGGLG
jgi:hypothetical protein